MTEEQKIQVIFVIGNPGAGKSTLVELAGSKPSFWHSIFHGLGGGKQTIRAAPHQSKYTILVDTPAFDAETCPDRRFISDVGTWLDKKYGSKNNVLIGIVFIHKISDNRYSDKFGPLQTVEALAQSLSVKNRISRVVFATSMWSGMQNQESVARANERNNLLKGKWDKTIQNLGVEAHPEIMRFDKSTTSVEQILQYVIR
ncbi:hypothetical protein BDZ94DRAFT_1320473 [Collybia nuda]|uniref:G domain-containing protein n=1 Tax=Collybia nuda TaxID=64659 RepID=A0A9P6CK98_9AGAR|nr:hypothetical protein BDZ94DRAFT_1320473 [Collybia nuda]